MPASTQPPVFADQRDLSDEEFAELDELLSQTPLPMEALDAVMLDGFLCGVLVQPRLIEPEVWLARVFDDEGRPLPENTDSGWRERTTALIRRRHAALNRAIGEDHWFSPLILELDEDNPPRPQEPQASLTPVSQAMMPWVVGFHEALEAFPEFVQLEDETIDLALARLYRHLPAENDEEREVTRMLDREHPLGSLDEAMDDLVNVVADLWDLTRDRRYHVETVRREAPKAGRNEACPCGSGKKFKHCHGA